SVAKSEALAVVHQSLLRGSSRKKRRSRIKTVLQVATPRKRVFAVRSEMVIEFCDEDVVVVPDMPGKQVSNIVEAIPNGEIIRNQIAVRLAEIGQHSRAGTKPERI